MSGDGKAAKAVRIRVEVTGALGSGYTGWRMNFGKSSQRAVIAGSDISQKNILGA